MYAAAGGASIANRRKQKRLEKLNKPGAQAAAARARSISANPGIGQQSGKFGASGNAIPTLQLALPPPVIQPTYGFHSSHERRTNRRIQHDRKSSSATTTTYHHHNHNHSNTSSSRNRLLAPPPISPIVQFPISPPPLSPESPNLFVKNGTQAITCKANNYSNNNSSPIATSVAFPFPPPSFLDLRVTASTSELQVGTS